MTKAKSFFNNSKTHTALSWWIAYRGVKILALYIIFQEHPIIWIPTVITTTILLYFSLRARKGDKAVD